ncbi:MAG: hypothetical protein ACI8R4_000973 [Paracoccaceae bacterium]
MPTSATFFVDLIGLGVGLFIGLILWAASLISVGGTAFIALVSVTLFFVLIVRFSLILPVAAIGKPLTASYSWEATRGAGWSIVVVVITRVEQIADAIDRRPFVGGFCAAWLCFPTNKHAGDDHVECQRSDSLIWALH